MSDLYSLSRGAPLLLGWALLTACPGDGGGSGTDDTSGGSGTDDTGAPTSGTPTGGGEPNIGAPCDHAGAPLDGDFVILSRDEAGCAGGLCLYVEDDTAPINFCDVDAECNEGDDHRFACDSVSHTCNFSPAWKLERSLCSQFCESAADCTVADPSSACATGFACEIVTGQCCDKVCVCLDDVTPDSFELPTMICEMDPTPECTR